VFRFEIGEIGDPEMASVGEENGFRDYILYEDINMTEGFCYYASPKNHMRLFFIVKERVQISCPHASW